MKESVGGEPHPAAGEPQISSAEVQELHPGDFYCEGGYMVFTEAYHLRRGFCCNSGCRHCPYRGVELS